MKDYKGFLDEAISAARLAQLAAKGKGGAAAAKMKADGLKSSASKSKPQQKKLPGSKGGALGGGALAKRDKKGFSSSSSAITRRDDIKKVDVRVDDAPAAKPQDEKQVGKRYGTTRGMGDDKKDNVKPGKTPPKEKGESKWDKVKKTYNDAKSLLNFTPGSAGQTGGASSAEAGVRYDRGV